METHFFLEKKANFPLEKITWPIFAKLSSMTKLKQQFERVHMVFWQLVWN